MREILAFHKATERKYRWDAAPLELYIPQWRVPEPVPDSIAVRIYTEAEYNKKIERVGQAAVSTNPDLRKKRIAARVVRHSEKTKTVRYDPAEGYGQPEIGSPYIPITLLDSPYAEFLIIEVEWRYRNE